MNQDIQLLEQILNDSNQMVQVSDIEHYSMLYANLPARIYAGHEEADYQGKHCYEYMIFGAVPFLPYETAGRSTGFRNGSR